MQPFAVKPARISVNGVDIARDAIAREAQNHPAATAMASFAAAARALVVRELLLQEARRLGLSAVPQKLADGLSETDEDALVAALVTREVTTPDVDAAACRRYYEANPQRFRSPDLFEASHILLPATPEGRAAAERLAAQLRADPRQFEDLARTHSLCPSAAQGGNLGQIGPGQTVAEFERALKAMAPGDISPPVESRFGLHIIRLARRIDGKALPFAQVEARIAAYLEERAHHAALHSYVRWLGLQADIEGIDLESGQVAPATVQDGMAAVGRFAQAADDATWTSAISSLNRAEDPARTLDTLAANWQQTRGSAS